LIARQIYKTKISALKVIEELDAGPVYLKRELSLDGSAEEIYIRASNIIFDMIRYIINNEPSPVKQSGKSVLFERRTPAESRIPDVRDLNKVFDWIRMLDAEGYPMAYLETENLRLEFSKANLKSGHILADVRITPRVE
jgi:methionyl-tRNA formyltransferase